MPTFANFSSPTPFQRFVDHHIDAASCLNQALHDEEEQLPTELQRRPARSIEHLMKPAKVAIQLMASLPQRCCHRSASSHQECSSQKGHHFLPGRCSEQWLKLGENRYNGVRRGHELPPW